MQGFRQLAVWQKSYALTLSVYKHTRSFPSEERYGLTSQLRRSVLSVPANIAEGYERNHRKEYVHFLHIARGSLGETETYLLLAVDLGYLSNETFTLLEAQRAEVGRILRGLINSLTEKS
ncbi:MAG: four helix bundle protein [Geobacter sp.]|nr:four helix bundle protein [Geobacter sp.]